MPSPLSVIRCGRLWPCSGRRWERLASAVPGAPTYARQRRRAPIGLARVRVLADAAARLAAGRRNPFRFDCTKSVPICCRRDDGHSLRVAIFRVTSGFSGAEDGIRTRDLLLGKEMLYH